MASVPTGTSGQLRLEANIPFTDAVARWSDVSWALYLDELGGSNLASNGSVAQSVVVEQAGVASSGAFGFDWTPGGNQSVLIASGITRIYHDADGIFRGGATAGVVAITGTMGATGSSSAGGPTQVIVYLFTPTLKVVPGTPTSVAASRVSDTSINVAWAQSSASNGQPTSNTVRRRINGGAWADAVTIAPALSTSLSAAANQKLVYGVKGTNAAGDSAWSADSTPIYTTPAAPTGVTATKVGSDIVIAFTSNVGFSEHQHLIEHGVEVSPGSITWDGSVLATKSAGTTSHTHTAPNPAQRHVYRVWAKNTDVGALISAKVQSNVVQLLAAPSKPNVATPPAFADKAATFRFAWAHNPVDSSAQTKYQYRYSLNGGSSWAVTSAKTASANQYHDFAASTWLANQAVTFQVRTKGAYDSGSDGDASYSPWSDSVTVTFKTKPTASITSPANASVQTQAALNVVLGFSQPESATFVSATIGLYQGATLLEEVVSTTLAGTLFTTRLADGGSYTVKATVTDSNGLVSAQVSNAFTVDYTEPVAAVVTLTYLPDSAIAQIGLAIPAAGGGFAAASSVTVDRIIDGESERLFTDYPSATSLTLLDTTPTINGDNEYRVTTKSIDGATTVVTAVLTTTETQWAFMSKGAGYTQIIKVGGKLQPKATPTVDGALVKAAGRSRPIGLYSTTGGLVVTGVAEFTTDFGSTPEEIEAFLLIAGKACYRDPSGRRMFGMLTGEVARETRTYGTFPYAVTETA